MSHKIIKLSPLVLAAVAAGFSTHAFSAGFALVDQGASGQGVAYAGAAAVGEDASTIYFNPAAMTRLSGQQIVVAGHIIVPKYDVYHLLVLSIQKNLNLGILFQYQNIH